MFLESETSQQSINSIHTWNYVQQLKNLEKSNTKIKKKMIRQQQLLKTAISTIYTLDKCKILVKLLNQLVQPLSKKKKKTSFSQKNNAKSDIILAITFNEIKKLRYNGQTHMFKAFSLNKNFQSTTINNRLFLRGMDHHTIFYCDQNYNENAIKRSGNDKMWVRAALF